MSKGTDFDRDVVEPVICRWINGRNGERDRMILRMYLFDGITYEKMLDRISVSLNLWRLVL